MSKFFGPEQPISYEGPSSKNPLAFRYYGPDRKVLGKGASIGRTIPWR